MAYTVDKAEYQMDPANSECFEAALDEAEGADIMMVSPQGRIWTLHVLSRIDNPSYKCLSGVW